MNAPVKRFRDMRLTGPELDGLLRAMHDRYDYADVGAQCAGMRAADRAKRLLPLWRDLGLRDIGRLQSALSRKLEADNAALTKHIAALQSQLAWTPVSDGLSEEEETLLVRQSRSNGDYYIYGVLWQTGLSLYAVTEEQPCATYEYGSLAEVLRDWDEFRRIELKDGETRGCDCDTPTTVHDVACPMNGGES